MCKEKCVSLAKYRGFYIELTSSRVRQNNDWENIKIESSCGYLSALSMILANVDDQVIRKSYHNIFSRSKTHIEKLTNKKHVIGSSRNDESQCYNFAKHEAVLDLSRQFHIVAVQKGQ